MLLTHRLGAVGQVVASFIFVIAFGYLTALMVVIIALTPDAFRVGTPDALFAAGMALLGIAGLVGLDVETTKWLLMVVALALFVGPAIYAVRWLRRRYEAKRWSDQSLTIDSTYLLCTLAHGGALAADADVPLVWSALPFLAYKVSLRASLGRVPRAATPPRLLLLRSFSLRGRGRRMFRNLVSGGLRP